MIYERTLPLCLLLVLFASIQITSQLKFEYEHGRVWKSSVSTQKGKEFITKLRDKFPDVLFWSGDHAPKEADTFIFTIPLDKEVGLLTEIQSQGIRVEEHIDTIKFLVNGPKVLRGLPLVKIPEKMDAAPPSLQSQSPQLPPSSTRTYVTLVGTIGLSVQLTNFKFDTPAKDELNEFVDPVEIMQKVTVPNNSPATVSLNLAEVLTLAKTVTLSFTETLSLEVNLGVNFNIADVGVGGSGSVDMKFEASSTQTVTYSDFETYSISKTVTIPPFTTIATHGFVNYMREAPFPFEAVATLTASLPPFNGTGQPPAPAKLYYCPNDVQWATCFYDCGINACDPSCADVNGCSCCSYTLDAKAIKDPFVIRDYLIASGETGFVIVGTSTGKLQLRWSGLMTGSFGLNAVFAVDQVLEP